MPEKQLIAFVVHFRRNQPKAGAKKTDGQETGLYIGRNTSDDAGIIVDMNGKVVPAPIWDYSDAFYKGCLVIKEDE